VETGATGSPDGDGKERLQYSAVLLNPAAHRMNPERSRSQKDHSRWVRALDETARRFTTLICPLV
jgi:hypothetical protein